MKYIPKKQRQEIIDDFNKVIFNIEESMSSSHFICHHLGYFGRNTIKIKPSAKLFLEEKPSARKHKKFFRHPSFREELVWWNTGNKGYIEGNIIDNKQRVLFLEHLIKLIEKQK